MPAERLSIRRIKEILRLKFEHSLTNRQIARSCNVSRATVADYLFRAARAELTWPLPDDMDDVGLENLLFSFPVRSPDRIEIVRASRPLPDFPHIHKELHHPHVTLQLLWEEYRETYPDGYQYSRFCQLYGNWSRKLDVTLRQEYKAGDKLFVDYAGPTVPIVSRDSGEVRNACLFVAVLGASNYTFAEATLSQEVPSWISSHCLSPINPSPQSSCCRNQRTAGKSNS